MRVRVAGLVVPQIVNFSVVGMYSFPRLIVPFRPKVDGAGDAPRVKKRFVTDSVSSRDFAVTDHATADRDK